MTDENVQRPALELGMDAKDFVRFQWLKSELVAFCRANGLPTGSSKADLTERIATFLRTGELLLPTTRPKLRADGLVPTLDTVITVVIEVISLIGRSLKRLLASIFISRRPSNSISR